MTNNIYPGKCDICKSPARNTICSNTKCKSWSTYRKQAATCKPLKEGLTSDNPIPVRCPKCICLCYTAAIKNDGAHCHKCGFVFPFDYVADRWYMMSSGIKNQALISKWFGKGWGSLGIVFVDHKPNNQQG